MQFGDNYSSSSSDRFLTDASYLSLQNINAGYTLPADWTKHAGIQKLRVYFAADNIWVWSQRQGLDPRQSISGGDYAIELARNQLMKHQKPLTVNVVGG